MPRGPKPTSITLTDDERAKLSDWVWRPTSAQRLALRARIALATADGQSNAAIAAALRVTLERSIEDYLQTHNQKPRPFVWTKSADLIPDKVRELAERLAPPEIQQRTSDSGH